MLLSTLSLAPYLLPLFPLLPLLPPYMSGSEVTAIKSDLYRYSSMSVFCFLSFDCYCSEVPEAKNEEGAAAFFAAHTALKERLDALQKVQYISSLCMHVHP